MKTYLSDRFNFVTDSKRKRFAVQSSEEDPLPPARVSVFHPHTKTADETPRVTRPCTSELEISWEAPQNVTAVCAYCLQPSCIAFSPFKPQGRSDARITNHTKWRKDYKWYWRTLKDCGLWENPIYQEKKEKLGCHIDDVREVMPHCLIKDVRERWPNPPNVLYQGHRRA